MSITLSKGTTIPLDENHALSPELIESATAARRVLSHLKSRGARRLRKMKVADGLGKVLFMSAFVSAAMTWLLRPELAGPIQHVLHNVTITQMPNATLGGLASEIAGWAKGPLGMVMAVATLLFGLGMGVMRNSIVGVIVGLVVALSLFFGPKVMVSVLDAGPGMAQSGTRVTKLAYAPALIAATKLDVESGHHPLAPAGVQALQKDVTWIAGHPTALRVQKGKTDPYSQSALEKLEYRLSLPLPATLRPGAAQAYAQHIRVDRAQAEDNAVRLSELDALLAVLLIAARLTFTTGRRNLLRVQDILDGLPIGAGQGA